MYGPACVASGFAELAVSLPEKSDCDLPSILAQLLLFSVRFGGLPPAGRSKRALKLT
jgi:hypothetical protein